MTAMTAATRTFEIEPQGAFSLAEANGFEFGARMARDGARMRLSFACDADWLAAGVELTQDGDDGTVHGRLYGDAPLDDAVAQVARVLSLDHDGREWAKVLEREAPLRAFADQLPGLRPVLFYSPYEAAAWSIISARVHRRQAARLRDEIAMELGTRFTLHGEAAAAFPSPGALLEGIDRTPLTQTKRDRLAGVAEAALDGALDLDHLRMLGPDAALGHLQSITGIGPFWATLIVVRASGFADALTPLEPRSRARALAAYGMQASATDAEFVALAERWRPFRTWATVLCRVAHERGL